MKVQVINKEGHVWTFKSVKDAKPFLKKDAFYTVKVIDGEKVRVYDDRELLP